MAVRAVRAVRAIRVIRAVRAVKAIRARGMIAIAFIVTVNATAVPCVTAIAT